MVDTNQEPEESKEPLKKKKEPPKKVAVKDKSDKKADKVKVEKAKGDDQGIVKKLLPVKKDTPSGKGQAAARPTQEKGQAVVKIKRFLKGAWSELKKVHWPDRRQIMTFTGVVVIAVVIVALLLFVIDSLLSQILKIIIPK